MKQITAFECGHCRKIYRKQGGASRHEKFCMRNPENVNHCSNCKHFKTEDVMRPSVYDSESMEKRMRLVCTKYDRILYSAAMEGKGYLERYPASFEGAMKMPKDCKDFAWPEF